VRVSAVHSTATRVSLGEIIAPRNEIIHPRDNPDGPDVFVGLEHIESGTGRRLGSEPIEKSDMTGRKARFRAGDVVYGYLRPYLNKVWLADFDGLCSVDQYVYRVDERRADAEFVAWFMRSPMFLSRAPVDTGPGQLPRIRLDEIARVELDLPPLSEQLRVAAVLRAQLDAAARMRAAAESQSQTLESLIEASLQDTFHGITPLSAHTEPDQAPCGWKWRTLTNLARLESGHTPSRRHPEWWVGDIPWLALPDIRELDCQVATETIETTNDLGIANSSARVLPAGTVVLSRTASVGFVAMMGRPMATSQDFVNWVCGPDLDPGFLMYLLRASRAAIRQLSSGAIHKTVYVPTVKAFQVCVPDLIEQQRIADVVRRRLATLAQVSVRVESQAAEIGRLPAALLRRAFSVAEAGSVSKGEGQ
jgi:type I restriction enzyme S subunit